MRTLLTVLVLATLGLTACNRTDDRITDGVKSRLAREPDPEIVEVTTRDGIVTLNGFVDSPQEGDRLEAAAREIRGVMAVNNRLEIRKPVATTAADLDRSKRDREVRAAVQERIAGVGLSGVEVEVRDGVVTLRGEVTVGDRAAAVRAATEASANVVRVDDKLVVR